MNYSEDNWELTTDSIWELIIESMQIPLILIIAFLFFKSSKDMQRPSLRWVALAFLLNFFYMINAVSTSKVGETLGIGHFSQTETTISILLDIFSTSLLFWSLISRVQELKNEWKYQSPTLNGFWVKLVVRLPNKIVLRVGLILVIIALSTFSLLYIGSDISGDIRGLVSCFAVVFLAVSFWENKPIAFGFISWAILQLWMFSPNTILGEHNLKTVGFTISFVAKLFILYGLFEVYIKKIYQTASALEREQSKLATEKARKEQEILEKEKIETVKNNMIDILRETFHEIFTPLKSIEKNLQSLNYEIGKDKRYQQLVSDSESVKTIVQVAYIDFGEETVGIYKQKLADHNSDKFKIVSLNNIIQKAIRAIKNSSQYEEKLSFKITYAPKCLIDCIPQKINQVIVNLIKNSIDAYSNGDLEEYTILIKTSLSKRDQNQQRYAVLQIEDNAGGIPSEIQEKVWERGFSTKKTTDGLIRGMGLNISKSQIEKHENCSISFESPIKQKGREPIKGVRFTIIFPLQEIRKPRNQNNRNET